MHITHTAPKDGTVIGAVTPGAIMSALLDGRSDSTFDPTKVTVHRHRQQRHAHLRDHEGRRRHQTFDGHAQDARPSSARRRSTTAPHDYAFMVKNVTGAQLSIVTGYKGTSDIGLAMERREVDGACGWDWASFKSQRAHWLKDNLVQRATCRSATSRTRSSPACGVPPIWKFIKTDDDRKAVELIIGQQVFHRSYIAPPGVPAAQLAILRTAFMATMKDPQFLADAREDRHRHRCRSTAARSRT